MTTIAYCNGYMVGDTQMSRGTEFASGAQKVFTTKHFLVGFSGSYGCVPAAHAFILKHESGCDPTELHEVWDEFPDFGEGVGILMVNKHGDIFYAGDCPPVQVCRKFEAIGTGGAFALGAMANGASATEAVQIASQYDVFTNTVQSTASIKGIKG